MFVHLIFAAWCMHMLESFTIEKFRRFFLPLKQLVKI